MEPSGADYRRGPFRPADQVQLTDPKGRMHTIELIVGKQFHTAKGAINHDDLIGKPEGIVVNSSNGTAYLAQRPLLRDFVLSMPRGATVVYPKDAAVIVGLADIFPGAKVLEAGVGSGALSCSLLRAIGADGKLHSYERREDFAQVAKDNVQRFFGATQPTWEVTVGDFEYQCKDTDVDRVVLDLLAPWDCLAAAAKAMRPGGVICIYVATTTQMSRTVEALREGGVWTEPESIETLLRTWHVAGLAVRPDHRMVGHTGFVVTSRRLADGTVLPIRRQRPNKGAYGKDWEGFSSAQTASD